MSADEQDLNVAESIRRNALRFSVFVIGLVPAMYVLQTGVFKYLDGTIRDTQCVEALIGTVVCSLIAGVTFAAASRKKRSRLQICLRGIGLAVLLVLVNASIVFVGCASQLKI